MIEGIAKIHQDRKEKHKLILDLGKWPIFVDADPDKLASILHNLIANAVTASPGGGEIRVTARQEPASAQYPSGTLFVQVKDFGIGLDEKTLKSVGRVTGRPAPGAKIGLYLVTCLLHAHQGTLYAESEGKGRGSTFSFRMPLKRQVADEG